MSRPNTAKPPTVLVTGASGFVGGHLARALHAKGYRLRLLARKTSDLTKLESLNFQRIEGDITDPISLIPAIENVDYIYHAGGLIKASSDTEFIEANGDGTKNVCAVAQTHAPKLKRLVYISSQAGCGPGEGDKPKDEMSPCQPLTPYGASKRLGEKWVQNFKLPWTIVRPVAVYGPEDRGMYEFFKVVANHLRPTLGADGRASVVFIDNLVDGTIRAGERPEGMEQIFFIADDSAYAKSEMAKIIQKELHTWAVPIRFPAWAVRFIARISESFAKGFGRAALFDSHKANELLATNWLVSIEKARMLLGYDPAIPTAEGLARTAAWYRQEGWL